MEALGNAITQMSVLFIITAVGYVAAKTGIVDSTGPQAFTRLIFYVTMPAMIIGSISGLEESVSLASVGSAFILGALQFFLFLGCGWLCCMLLRIPKDQRPIWLFMSVFSNLNFIGFPVIISILGSNAILYASILIMVLILLANAVGIPMLARSQENKSLKKAIKAVLNPPAISSIVALALFFSHIQMPEVISSTLVMLGDITTPGAMLIVGVILAQAPLHQVFCEVKVYPFILIKMIVMPLAACFVLQLFIDDFLLLCSFTVLAAMPVGAMAPALVAMYGWKTTTVVSATMLSTLAMFIVIPIIMLAMATF